MTNLLDHSDFVMLQETHGTIGNTLACDIHLRGKASAFWSCIDQNTCGIGDLVNTQYMTRHRLEHSSMTWTVLEAGRVARLSIRALACSVDLFCVYLHHECRLRRRASLAALCAAFAPRHLVQSFIAGDFNFVTSNDDRLDMQTHLTSGDSDLLETLEFDRLL